MERDVLMHQMEERFREEFAKALDAVEHTANGHWIDVRLGSCNQCGRPVASSVCMWASTTRWYAQ